MDEAAEEDEKTLLHPQDIDAYWLQRRIAATFTDIDASRSQTLAEDVLAALAVSPLLGWPAFLSLYAPESPLCAALAQAASVEHCSCVVQPAQHLLCWAGTSRMQLHRPHLC